MELSGVASKSEIYIGFAGPTSGVMSLSAHRGRGWQHDPGEGEMWTFLAKGAA
jgi:hypothetical protein